ncbi:hypothetical protein Rsub_12812 [Raphidocelis subcapitata]|uniref:Fibronectin type-III domain-containing protein n=1 Tax=Raphidocelis subcapitata TaxID=307507 RepID=A0A2V0PJC9_9CHLO|nr:hypothetical protein Rsub_12812 [Raphidocelis subcapitata]|eukprot:GBF99904.1 hypothetical protein Rsub_12812 [Raphidocelis subcapitata]
MGHEPPPRPPAEGAPSPDAADEEIVEQEQLPPPPPLAPELAVPPPRVADVRHTTARVEWQAASSSFPDPGSWEDPRQGDVQARCTYSLPQQLQMQEVATSSGDSSSPEDRLREAAAHVVEGDWRTVHEAPCCSAEVTALRPGRFYAVRVRCTPLATLDGAPPVVFPPVHSQLRLFRTEPTPPGPMQPPSLAQRARNALKLKWALPDETGGEPILQYVLEMAPPPLGWEGPPNDEGFYEVYSGEERSFKAPRLAPGVRYTFRIMAFNALGPSPWSLCSAFSTQASVPAAPEPPARVACTSDTATLAWAPPADNGAPISGYTLEVDDGRGGDFRIAHTGAECRATVAGLRSGLPYRFRLLAENMEGRSYWSAPTTATTAATVPSTPVGLAVMGVNRTSVTLAWQPPAGDGGAPITGYQVQLQAVTRAARSELGAEWLIVYDGPSTATAFSALHAGCSYMARVSATNSAGASPFSAAVQFVTSPDVPAAPPVPDAEVDATSLLLRWDPPLHDGGAPVSSYRVEMRCSPHHASSDDDPGTPHSLALTPHFLTIYSGSEACVQVTDLAPGTSYEYRVMAVNGQGGSPWSPIGSATTLPSVPAAPAAPVVSACSSHSLHLSWREPHSQGAPVTSYTVNMARLLAPLPRPLANGHSRRLSADSDVGSGDADGDSGPGSSGGDAAGRLRYETVYTGPAQSCEVRGLEPASAYSLRVRAHNAMGGSAWGDAVTVTTAAAAPGAPTGLAVSAASSCEVDVKWAPPLRDNGAAVTGYLLEMAVGISGAGSSGISIGSSSSSGSGAGKSGKGSSKLGAAGAWTKVWQGAETGCSVSCLLPGRRYSFRVRACSAQGLGPWCEPAVGATLPAEPGPPGQPAVTQRTATSLRAKWTLPAEDNGAAVTSFALQLRPMGGDAPFALAYEGVELGTRVAGLEPGTTYELRVAARNRAGQGPWSDATTAATALRPPAPPVCAAAEVESGAPLALRVTWTAPADAGPATAEAVGYEVEAQPGAHGAAGGGASGGAAFSGAAAALGGGALRQQVGRVESVVLPGAVAGCSYSVRLRAVGAGGSGHSAWSEAVRIQVPADAAPAPEAGSAAACSSTDTPAGGSGRDGGSGSPAGSRKPGAKTARRAQQPREAVSAAAVGLRRGAAQAGVAKGPPRRSGLASHIPKPVRDFWRQVQRLTGGLVILLPILALVLSVVILKAPSNRSV